MDSNNVSYWDCLKSAFNLKVPIWGLGGMPINKLLLSGFSILGIAHPGFWLLGLAYESAYLLYLPGNGRFQNYVRGMRLASSAQSKEVSQEDFASKLSASGQNRFFALKDRCKGIYRVTGSLIVEDDLNDLSLSGLNQLLTVFLKLLLSKEKIEEMLAQIKQDELAKEVAELEAAIAKEPETSLTRHSYEQTLEIQKRRLDNLKNARENLRVVKAEMNRIEKQVALIAEETTVGSDPSQLSARLDGVSKSLGSTSRWMSEHAEFFSSLDESVLMELNKESN